MHQVFNLTVTIMSRQIVQGVPKMVRTLNHISWRKL